MKERKSPILFWGGGSGDGGGGGDLILVFVVLHSLTVQPLVCMCDILKGRRVLDAAL